MKMPHTHYTRGKSVWLRLKNGSEHVGKFIERKGRFIVLDCGRFTTKELAAMSFRRHATEGRKASPEWENDKDQATRKGHAANTQNVE